jgi:two-component system response regulator YesN
MLKIILIDDEETNIELLKQVLDWEALGFQIAGTATDGIEGLALYHQTAPDVILVDIRMPQMDGIAYIREIRKLETRVKIVILSAYAEFEYARQAIEYGIHAYLLKPINEQKLEQLLLAIKQEWLDEAETSRSIVEYDFRKLLDSFDADRVDGADGVDATAESSTHYPIHKIFVKPFVIACLALEWEHIEGKISEGDLLAMLGDAMEQWLDPSCIKIERAFRQWVVIYEGASDHPEEVQAYFLQAIHRLSEKCLADLGIAVLCGISESATSLAEFRRAYHQAGQALLSCFYINSTYAVVAAPIRNTVQKINTNEFATRKRSVLKEVQAGNAPFLIHFIHDTFTEFRNRQVHPDDVYKFCHEFTVLLQEELSSIDAHFSSVISDAQVSGLKLHRRWSSLNRTMEELAVKAGSALRSLLDSNKNYAMIRKAKEFAMLHFHEASFTLKDAAEHMELSKNHFSKLYKEQTGENYWDYVIHLKMELAKQLLRDTNKTNYDIADRIGYSSEYHFARTFAKITGMTATQYRKTH